MFKSASSSLSFQHLALALLLIGTFWMLVQSFTYLDWGNGGSKAMLLVFVAVVSTMILLDYRYSRSIQGMNVTRVPIAGVVTSLIILFILYEVISTPARALKIEAVVMCLIIGAPLAAALIGVPPRGGRPTPSSLYNRIFDRISPWSIGVVYFLFKSSSPDRHSADDTRCGPCNSKRKKSLCVANRLASCLSRLSRI